MKNFFVIALLATALHVHAQEEISAELKGLVEAERAFIKMAKEKNTRDAFINFLADDGVTFGNDIQKGKDYLNGQQPNESWLLWDPVYSAIAASGDFGFNTGPWEFRAKRSDEKAVAYGQFVTVWKKVDGEWKAAIDIGVSHDTPAEKEIWRASSVKSVAAKPLSNNRDFIMTLERKFQAEMAQKNAGAYKQFLSSEARLYRQKRHPLVSQQQIDEYLSTTTEKFSFTSIDGSIASSGDLAFVYGKAVVYGTETRTAFFMRIWRVENGTWKIVLDIVT
jgi:ketosteroid isomerase-like protein